MVNIRSAAKAFDSLNGIICVYKPSCVTLRQVQGTVLSNLCRDLNALPDRPLEQRVEIIGATNAPMAVKVVPNYADNTLVVGPRYMKEDLRISWSNHLGLFSSGVLILGINSGTKLTYKLNLARPTRAYKIHGQLGKATDTYFWNGKTVERSSYGHVSHEKIDSIVAHMQAAHQKTMFQLSGVDMGSQTAYELASQGVIRPANGKLPVVYGMKCVYFKPPNFTLEIQCINEYDKYLWTLIHDLGLQLKTSAHCTGVQCIRQGKFDTDLALLRKHWQLEHIINNMRRCDKILQENERLLMPDSAKLSA